VQRGWFRFCRSEQVVQPPDQFIQIDTADRIGSQLLFEVQIRHADITESTPVIIRHHIFIEKVEQRDSPTEVLSGPHIVQFITQHLQAHGANPRINPPQQGANRFFKQSDFRAGVFRRPRRNATLRRQFG
jgi:hypothetical protein